MFHVWPPREAVRTVVAGMRNVRGVRGLRSRELERLNNIPIGALQPILFSLFL